METWREKFRRFLVSLGLLTEPGVHYIGGSDVLPPPLSREREAELLARPGDPAARGGGGRAQSALKSAERRLCLRPALFVWRGRGWGPRPRQTPPSPRAAGARRRPKAAKSQAPQSMGPGAGNIS